MKILFVVVMTLVSLSNQALAWSCLEQTVQEGLWWADVVFVGQATKVWYVDARGYDNPESLRVIVTFQVSGYWKGDVRRTMTLHTYNRFWIEGYFFTEGEKFIIYAKKYKAKDWLGDGGLRPTIQGVVYPKPDEDILTTIRCTRTNRLIYAAKDLKELGFPKTPTK